MVNAAVQKNPVVRNQDKAFLGLQVRSNYPARLDIQMTGGLVNKQKIISSQKQRRQQKLGGFTTA